MGFNFGFPAVDNGQLDPSTQAMIASMANPPAADPQATAPQPAPQPQQQQASPQGLPDIKVSPLEAVASWLAHGGTPAEAAQAARAVKVRNIVDSYNLQLAQMRAQGLQSAGDDERKAVLYGDTPAGKAYADRIATHALSGGQTLVNGGPGGQPFTATTYGVDHSTPYALGPRVPGGFQSGPQMPGDTQVDAASGGLYNNQGPTSAAFGRPQVVAPGSTLQNYQTSVRGQPGQGGPAPQGQGGTLDPLAFFKGFVLPHEGGLNPHDMNGAPTKYGINQAANPGVNVSALKPDDAAQIFAQKYYGPSGAANMPAPLAAVHADTYFINPKMANAFLQQSGGDPNAYLALREAWMGRMVQTKPKAVPYAKAWAQRNADLGTFIQSAGAPSPPPPPDPNGPPVQNVPGYGRGGMPAQVTTLSAGKQPEILPPSDPLYARYAPGTVLKKAPNGEVSADTSNAFGPDQLISLRGKLNDEEPVKNWRIANTAYGAMTNAAAQPNGGIRAYALRDTFARLINPGAVARVGTIEAIKQSQGVPANIQAYLMNLKGDGDVPPQIAQQILDISRGFLSSHYAEAKAMSDNYAQFAGRHQVNPADVTVQMGAEPQRMILGPVPPPQQRVPAIYSTPKGPLQWTGSGWRKTN